MNGTMTDTLTPIHIGDRIHNLPTELAGSIALTRQRMDAAKKEMGEEDEDEDDEPEESMKDRMASLREMKKDSDDIQDHEDSLESAVMETILRMDAMEDEYDDELEDSDSEDMEEQDPAEMALDLVQAFEAAKPYLPVGTTFQSLMASDTDDGIFDSYDIYSVAVMSQYPEIDIDHSNDDEVYGAFQMMASIRSPMQQIPSMVIDSADDDGDRMFSQQLGLRADSSTHRPIGGAFQLKSFY